MLTSPLKKIILLVALPLLTLSSPSFAWLTGNNVTINSIIIWQEAEEKSPLYFRTSNNLLCYVPANEKFTQSFIISLHASKTPVSIHCHDLEEQLATFAPAHKFHRMITQ